MDVKVKLTELLEKAVEIMDCPQMNEIAEYLAKNRVTILPKGAIVLTKEEIAALNEYQRKHGAGGEPVEK